jgi:hypothetical protein
VTIVVCLQVHYNFRSGWGFGWSRSLACDRKHFQEMSVELQIPPLRFASVGMTKGEGSASIKCSPLGGPKAMENSRSSTFIPTEAKSDGGTCYSFQPLTNSPWEHHSPLCHPDRSEAKWRDLQFSGHLLEMFFSRFSLLLQDSFHVDAVLDRHLVGQQLQGNDLQHGG